MKETTFGFIKPPAVARGDAFKILDFITEKSDLKFVDLKMMTVTREIAEEHYAHIKGEIFFEDVISGLTSGPIIAFVLEGENAIKAYRGLMGETKKEKWVEGTIRHEFGKTSADNAVHGSDSPETVEIETKRFMSK